MDSRYAFIRSDDPFKGLEDYASSPEIKVRKKELIYPLPPQQDLPGYSYQQKLKEDLGTFFEIVGQGIYGGVLQDNEILNNQLNLFTGKEEFVRPDLKDRNGNYREFKGFVSGESLKLLNRQIKKYAEFVRGGNGGSEKGLSFELFRHRVKHLFKRFRTLPLEDLVSELL